MSSGKLCVPPPAGESGLQLLQWHQTPCYYQSHHQPILEQFPLWRHRHRPAVWWACQQVLESQTIQALPPVDKHIFPHLNCVYKFAVYDIWSCLPRVAQWVADSVSLEQAPHICAKTAQTAQKVFEPKLKPVKSIFSALIFIVSYFFIICYWKISYCNIYFNSVLFYLYSSQWQQQSLQAA